MDPTQHKQSEQTSVFDSDNLLPEYDRDQHLAGVRKARNTLFFAGGLMFVVRMINLLIQLNRLNGAKFDYAILSGIIGLDILLLAAFVGLGIWTKRKPYYAILVGVTLFCAVQMLAMFGDPTSIYRNVIVKLVVFFSLVSALKRAKALQRKAKFVSGEFQSV